MRPINSLSPQAATVIRPATESANASQTASIGTIPAAHFSHYHVLGDGDCLFRAMYMGLSNQPGAEPNQDQVMGLRQHLANYVYQNQLALTENPAFEGLLGVQNLYDLLLTPGQWNHNAGDLVAPLLAQVSGRPVAVLQPTQEGTAYNVRQVFPTENPTFPPGLALSGEPTICLAHINNNHYGYLEERYPNVLFNALSLPQNTNPLTQGAGQPALGETAPEEVEPASIGTHPSDHKKAVRKQLSYTQAREAIQLWQANPDWGVRRVADEYMKRNPGLTIGRNHIQALKKRHPDLLDAGLGSQMQNKLLNPEQERALTQLWQKNPRWGERKLANEFKRLHPNLNVTKNVISKVKKRNPILHELAPGSSLKEKNSMKLKRMQLLKFGCLSPAGATKK